MKPVKPEKPKTVMRREGEGNGREAVIAVLVIAVLVIVVLWVL